MHSKLEKMDKKLLFFFIYDLSTDKFEEAMKCFKNVDEFDSVLIFLFLR